MKYLDKKYMDENDGYSNKIMLTKVWFYNDPKTKELHERYFLTAANRDDENKIHKILSQHHEFYTVRFREKFLSSDD